MSSTSARPSSTSSPATRSNGSPPSARGLTRSGRRRATPTGSPRPISQSSDTCAMRCARVPRGTLSGEEFGSSDVAEPRATWYIDPVDGTTNFVHGLPWSSFSIAVCDEDGTAVGAVADPYRHEILSAVRGRGARRDGRPVQCSNTRTLVGGIFLTELSMQSLRSASKGRASSARLPVSQTSWRSSGGKRAMEAERQPTLADVARVARVATSTASRALQESPRISESTKVRVRAAARGLGYRPNRIAQSLRTRTANIVGIVVPDSGAPFYSRVVKGAQTVFEQNGYAVLMMNPERRPERETAAIHTLLEHRVRGVLVATSGGSTAEPEVPTVYFDNIVANHGVGNVTRANVAGMALLVEHLHAHGHDRVAYIGGPPELTSGIERLEGYRAAVRDFG